MVLFIGVTGMLETIFIDHTFGSNKCEIQVCFVPAALPYLHTFPTRRSSDLPQPVRHAAAEHPALGEGLRVIRSALAGDDQHVGMPDRKSTRLNSSHTVI